MQKRRRVVSGNRKWLWKGLLLLGSFLFCVLCLELVARVYFARSRQNLETLEQHKPARGKGPFVLADTIRPSANPRLVYEMREGLSGRFWDVDVSINAQGYRGVARGVEKPARTFRIACLGDSICFGLGAPEQTTYCEVLERTLNAYAPGDWRFEVLNFGVSGYNTAMEFEQFQKKVLAYKPDVVILEYCINDLSLPNFIQRRENVWALNRSFMAEFWRRRVLPAWRQRQVPATEVLTWAPVYRDAQGNFLLNEQGVPVGFLSEPAKVPREYRHMVGPENVRKTLTEWAALCDREGVAALSFVFVDHFEQIEKDRASSADPLYTWICKHLDTSGWSRADLAPVAIDALRRRNLSSPYLWIKTNDQHPNPFFHCLIARVLLARLMEGEMLPEAAHWVARSEEMEAALQAEADEALAQWLNAERKAAIVKLDWPEWQGVD